MYLSDSAKCLLSLIQNVRNFKFLFMELISSPVIPAEPPVPVRKRDRPRQLWLCDAGHPTKQPTEGLTTCLHLSVKIIVQYLPQK